MKCIALRRFCKGDYVQVQLENAAVRTRKPHLRTPGYIFGLVGTVERECVGMADNPEGLAFRQVHKLSSLLYLNDVVPFVYVTCLICLS